MDKYVAIKVRGLGHWLWFEVANTTIESGQFCGNGGWGKAGALTSIAVDMDEVIGRIESSELQYSTGAL